MGVYRIELAKTKRAGCAKKECKDQGVKIEKGELRFGSQVDFQGNVSWSWRHWGCVTPAQIANLIETCDRNTEYIDGYDEIGEENQARVTRALEEGHVADEDWRGNVEMNRVGAPKRTPKKKAAEKENEGIDVAEAESPTKAAPKKRKAKTEEDDEDAPAAKPKRAPKKAKKTVTEEGDRAAADVEEDKSAVTKKKRAPAKKAAKDAEGSAEGAANGTDEETKLPPKKRGPRKAAATKKSKDDMGTDGNMDDDEDALPEPPKKRLSRKAAAPKKAKEEIDEDGDLDGEEVDAEVAEAPKRGRPKKAVVDGKASVSKGRKGKKAAQED